MFNFVNGVFQEMFDFVVSPCEPVAMSDKEVILALIATYAGKSPYGALRTASKAIGVSEQSLANWRARGAIPAGHRFAVRRLANTRAKLALPLAWLDPRKDAA